MVNIKIEVIIDHDELKRERYDFSLFTDIGFKLVLDYYCLETKPSKRHRTWKAQEFWARLDQRQNTIKENPAISDEVKFLARNEVLKLVDDMPVGHKVYS